MLNKLLKYDLKWCYKPLVVFYILAIFFSFVLRYVKSLNQSLMVIILGNICVGIVISFIVNILINCVMRNWVRFIRNIYKDESYLTHTLPVSKNEIYLSKVLTAVITGLTSLFVIVLCLAIGFVNKNNIDILKDFGQSILCYFDNSIFSVILIMFLIIFLELLFMILCGILSIVIGFKYEDLKIVKSIVIGFILYICLSAISIGSLFVLGLFNDDIMAMFNSSSLNINALKTTILIGVLWYLLCDIGIYFLGNRLLNKGVNVE